METNNLLKNLNEDELFMTAGGYKEDYDFGYKIGAGAKAIYNGVREGVENVVDWAKTKFQSFYYSIT